MYHNQIELEYCHQCRITVMRHWHEQDIFMFIMTIARSKESKGILTLLTSLLMMLHFINSNGKQETSAHKRLCVLINSNKDINLSNLAVIVTIT